MASSVILARNESGALHVRAEQLKSSLGSRAHLKKQVGDPITWTEQQELQSILEKLLLTDLSMALEKKAEIDLWNFCFKDYITALQSQIAQNLKQPTTQSDARITLNWFLEMASGFYFMLIEKIRAKYDLDIPFLRRGSFYGLSSSTDLSNKASASTEAGNINYLLQHCLVHLGDLARYRGQLGQAETFYQQAIQVSPSSGQAYNQIGLIKSAMPKTDTKLAAVFYYVRSIALRHPFPAGATNLSKLYSNIETSSSRDRDETKPITDASGFLSTFLHFMAMIHRAAHLKAAAHLASLLCDALTSLVAAEKLMNTQLKRCVAITIFELERHVVASHDDIIKMSSEEIGIVRLLTDLLAAMLNAFLLPVYTIKQGCSLLDYFALPSIKLILSYIQIRPIILSDIGFMRRLQIWPGLCRLLNQLTEIVDNEKPTFPALVKDSFPLEEDFELQAFLPLSDALNSFNFKMVYKMTLPDNLSMCRALRLIQIGQNLSSGNFSGLSVIKFNTTFEPVELQSINVTDLLDDLEINSSDSDSENLSDDKDDDVSDHVQVNLPSSMTSPASMASASASSRKRYSKQNVALNSIFSQMDMQQQKSETQTSKQVTFKSPSGSQDEPPRGNFSANLPIADVSPFQPEHHFNKAPDYFMPPPPPPGVPGAHRQWFDPGFPYLDSTSPFHQQQRLFSSPLQQPSSTGSRQAMGQFNWSDPTGLQQSHQSPGLQSTAPVYGDYSLFSGQTPWLPGRNSATGGNASGGSPLHGQHSAPSIGQSPLERLLQKRQNQ